MGKKGDLSPSTRGLLATDHVILNHGQVTWTTPELAPPLLTITPHQREDVSALDRFNVHRCPTRRVFSGTGLELMTYLPWSDTLTTGLPQPCFSDESTFEILQHKAQFVHRRRGEKFHSDCVVLTVKHPTKIMIWSDTSGKGTGRLEVVKGMMRQDQYKDVLQNRLIPQL
ncbi:uncharacterized protein TNCV_318711 [Trichonephila clavipes]|nr:uncharacterized protein TNCV_318711 [Trichonephila clavipes]